MTKHESICEAPICVDCKDIDTVWYPGELVCSKRPLVSLQKKQNTINRELRLGTFKNKGVAYTTLDLKTRSI